MYSCVHTCTWYSLFARFTQIASDTPGNIVIKEREIFGYILGFGIKGATLLIKVFNLVSKNFKVC